MNNLQKKQSEQHLNSLILKNKNYYNSYSKYGIIGILIKINDNINKLLSLNQNSISVNNTEKLRENLIDLQNYSNIAIMEIDNKKKVEFKNTTNIDTAFNSSATHYTNSI